MKRSSKIRAPVTIIFGALAFVAFADTSDLNRDLASLYTRSAENSAINLGQALAIIDIALEFDPTSSDAIYLRAYLQRDIQDLTVAVIADFKQALASDNFSTFDTSQAIVALSEVLLRTGRPEEALSWLEAADLTHPNISPGLVSDVLAVEARGSVQLEAGARANLAIADGRRKFPDDPRFFLLELEAEPSPSFRYRRELDRLLRAGAHGDVMRVALLRYALTAPIQPERTWAFDTYLSAGGRDPAIVLALTEVDGVTLTDAFVSLGGLSRRDVTIEITQRLASHEATSGEIVAGESSEALARILDIAERFSGPSLTDGDGDGFWEERVTVSEGLIRRWEIDADQNGIVEVDVLLEEGEPVQITVEQSDGMVVATYDAYPYLMAVTVPLSTGSRTYTLLPFTLRLPVIQLLPAGGPRLHSPLELPREFSGLDLNAVRIAAEYVQVLDPAGRVVEHRVFDNGVVVRSTRDTNSDGVPDHLIIYRLGRPVAGLRDIDDDGYFEVAEAYVGGQIAMIAVDEDDNGTPDVTEYVRDDTRQQAEREWDLDQDGTIDIREFGIWTDTVRREFSFLESAK